MVSTRVCDECRRAIRVGERYFWSPDGGEGSCPDCEEKYLNNAKMATRGMWFIARADGDHGVN